MTLASTVPPKFDCELINDVSKTRVKELMAKYLLEKIAMKDIHDSYLVFVGIFMINIHVGFKQGNCSFCENRQARFNSCEIFDSQAGYLNHIRDERIWPICLNLRGTYPKCKNFMYIILLVMGLQR